MDVERMKSLRLKYRKSLSMKERDKIRKVQDRLLSLPVVQKFVRDKGENTPLWEGGPSAAQLRAMLYEKWTYKMEEVLNEWS